MLVLKKGCQVKKLPGELETAKSFYIQPVAAHGEG
jgi:hypothetical protein